MPPEQAILDNFWECPKCGTQMAMGGAMHPPVCQAAHKRTEMEQITAPRWRTEAPDGS